MFLNVFLPFCGAQLLRGELHYLLRESGALPCVGLVLLCYIGEPLCKAGFVCDLAIGRLRLLAVFANLSAADEGLGLARRVDGDAGVVVIEADLLVAVYGNLSAADEGLGLARRVDGDAGVVVIEARLFVSVFGGDVDNGS